MTKHKLFLCLCISAFLLQNVKADDSKLPVNFFKKTLGNGLEVLVIEDNTVPLATIEICVRNGSYTESPEYNGLSHLYEHMFFKANKDYPSQEKFLDRLHELGISFNGTTSNERVNYFVTLGTYNLKPGMEFINSAVRYPLFDKEEMKKENVVVDGEFQRNESNPGFFLFDELNYKMWGDHYCRKNPIGDHAIIRSATPEKMKVIQNKFYFPNNSLLCIAGNVNHEEVFAMADQVFGSWQSTATDPFKRWPVPEFDHMVGQNNFMVVNENAKAPLLAAGMFGPDTRNDVKSTYAADVFSFILSETTAPLQKSLIESGLAFNVGLNYQTCKYAGPITLFMVPNPAKVKEAVKVLKQQMSKWDSDDYFTDEQLNTAKNQLAITDAYGKEKASDYIHTITYWWASSDINYYVNYIDNVKKVTRQDIKDYVRKYIRNQPSAWGLLTNESMRDNLKLDTSIFDQN